MTLWIIYLYCLVFMLTGHRLGSVCEGMSAGVKAGSNPQGHVNENSN